MKIRVTSVTASEVGPVFGRVAVALEDALNPVFEKISFGGGIDQFTVVAVSVDPDSVENEKFCKKHNVVGSFKNMLTMTKEKRISVALPFNPCDISVLTEKQVRSAFCLALENRLGRLDLKIPNEFDLPKFVETLRRELKELSKND